MASVPDPPVAAQQGQGGMKGADSLLSEALSYGMEQARGRGSVPRAPRRMLVSVTAGEVAALLIVGVDLGKVVNNAFENGEFADSKMVDVLHQPADLDGEVPAQLDTSRLIVVAHDRLVPVCRDRDAAGCRKRPFLAGSGLRA